MKIDKKIQDQIRLGQLKIQAESPYNDGWTQEGYRKEYEKLLKKIQKKNKKKSIND